MVNGKKLGFPPGSAMEWPQQARSQTESGNEVIFPPTASLRLKPCLLIPLLLGGQVLVNRLNLSKTVYGITDSRVIVVIGSKKKTVRSHLLSSATDFRMEEWPDGLGTISFGPHQMWPYGSTRFNQQPSLTLENISDAAQVFRIISEAVKSHRN